MSRPPRSRRDRPRADRRRRLAPVIAIVMLVVVGGAAAAVLASASGSTAPPAVAVFPIPGARVATPGTQITFRGLPTSRFGRILVTGSKSGVHTGVVLSDSDNDGGSFIPATPFDAGEQVTVKTSLKIIGAAHGAFTFTVADPAGAIRAGLHAAVKRSAGDVWRFASRPDLTPAAVHVDRDSPQAADGKLFVASQEGPVQNGPELLGPHGDLIYFKPVPQGQTVTDFRTQTYRGQPVLTWWQGVVSAAGVGQGQDEIYDNSYRPLATVKAGNGLDADLHEFQLTPHDTALVTAEYPVYWDASAVKGAGSHEIVMDAVAQEIDVATGLVLFEWDSLDHVPVTDSYEPPPADPGHPWDYFHINSVQWRSDGTLLISARDTWAVYKVSRRSGATEWTLGGKRSSFKMGENTRFAFQHDARLRPGNEMTIFDDGAGPPVVHHQSRALTLKLDTGAMTATVVRQDAHNPSLLAAYEGNVQRLDNGDEFVGWGQQPYLSEYDRSGALVFDARFVDALASYRAYRFSWTGTPVTLPAAAVKARGGGATVYASWNGTTDTARWRILAGPSTSALTPVTTVAKDGFETAIPLPRVYADIEVQALDASGKVLATSKPVQG